MAVTSPFNPSTAVGVDRLVVVPSPSCPDSLLPQQKTLPALVKAHVCPDPEAIAIVVALANVLGGGESKGVANNNSVGTIKKQISWDNERLKLDIAELL
jgi:hypothetical protein